MGVYDFEVLKDGGVIAAEQTVALPDTRAAWPKIAELRRRLMSRATKSVSRTRPAELSSSLASLRFAAAPTGFRVASARICKCAYLAPCQNNNDQRSRKETY
jgi:hypothetical protein